MNHRTPVSHQYALSHTRALILAEVRVTELPLFPYEWVGMAVDAFVAIASSLLQCLLNKLAKYFLLLHSQ